MAKKQKSVKSESAKDTEEKIVKAPQIGPFDIIKMMFTDKAAFDALSDLTLSRNSFMINRVMSIQFPLQAQVFNNLDINTAAVVRIWSNFAVSSLGYGRVPSFVYTKSPKKETSTAKSGITVDKELREAYCKQYGYSNNDFNDMVEFYPDYMKYHIDRYDKLTSHKEQMKNFS